MSSYYAKLTHLISSWPGLGAVSSHRLLDAFIAKPYMKNTLEKLLHVLDEHPLCRCCQLPYLSKESCKNCQKEQSTLLVFSSISDALLFQYIHPNNEYQYFALKDLLDHKVGQSFSDIGIETLSVFLKQRPGLKKVIFISNHSAQAQATYFALEQLLESHLLFHPSWPNQKIPALSGLAGHEIAQLHCLLEEILAIKS